MQKSTVDSKLLEFNQFIQFEITCNTHTRKKTTEINLEIINKRTDTKLISIKNLVNLIWLKVQWFGFLCRCLYVFEWCSYPVFRCVNVVCTHTILDNSESCKISNENAERPSMHVLLKHVAFAGPKKEMGIRCCVR